MTVKTITEKYEKKKWYRRMEYVRRNNLDLDDIIECDLCGFKLKARYMTKHKYSEICNYISTESLKQEISSPFIST